MTRHRFLFQKATAIGRLLPLAASRAGRRLGADGRRLQMDGGWKKKCHLTSKPEAALRGEAPRRSAPRLTCGCPCRGEWVVLFWGGLLSSPHFIEQLVDGVGPRRVASRPRG